jgi:hypothetical protein
MLKKVRPVYNKGMLVRPDAAGDFDPNELEALPFGWTG